MKTCYIFGALECSITDFKPQENDLIIAADGGYSTLKKLNIKPDLVVGDFDSLGSVPDSESIVKHPVKKDDTDTLLAIKIGFQKGYKKFIIYGAIGGRLDHTVATIQSATYVAQNGGIAYICDDNHTVTAIKNSGIKFKKTAKGYISVFALSGIAKGVTINGLLYPLDNAEISPDFPLGVSNEFLGKESEISVTDGILTIVFEGKPSDIV
ncbi:MAG: thiamine diphosphokinase [Ruminococcaceae bacterium]|nr:thiamine diphosphokinase [Oscillospiraceae bacterium]